MSERLRIGVSACLVGQPVRFDGGHRRDDFVTALGRVAELVPVCPEIELGLGAPRESLRLIRRGPEVALVAPASGRDLTEAMRRFAAARAVELAGADLDGFILKKDSPSCGLGRVRIYREAGPPERNGRGLFAEALIAANPLLPVEEEGRLRDEALRESFLRRLVIHHRLRRLFAADWRLRELIAFHASVKLDLLACSPAAYRALGRLVAHAATLDPARLAADYSAALMNALAPVPTRGRHVNVLQHLAGYFHDATTADERRELGERISAYAAGREPRETPLDLLRHHARRRSIPWLSAQTYLERILP